MNQCTAITKQGRRCHSKVEEWRVGSLCHVHDPNGKFRQQQKKKGYKTHIYELKCKHTWYMREEGIKCTKCNLIWEPGMD